MLKKSLKYLLIATVNLTLLTALLALWTDDLELMVNDGVRPIEFLKILGFTAVSLIGMRVLVTFLRRRNIVALKTRVVTSALLTFLISSYLYIDYSPKVIENVLVSRKLRNRIADKIKPANMLAFGTRADSLTIKEYQFISGMIGLPKLPVEASNIKYVYSYDGFLPDYVLTLTYDLPLEMKVDIINFKKGDFSKEQTFEIINNIKRVTYTEGET